MQQIYRNEKWLQITGTSKENTSVPWYENIYVNDKNYAKLFEHSLREKESFRQELRFACPNNSNIITWGLLEGLALTDGV